MYVFFLTFIVPSIKDINKNRKSNAKKPAPGGVGKRSNATQEAKKASSQAIRRNVVNLIQSDMDKEKMKVMPFVVTLKAFLPYCLFSFFLSIRNVVSVLG